MDHNIDLNYRRKIRPICIRVLVVRQHGFDFKTPFSKEVGRLVVQEGPDPVVGH